MDKSNALKVLKEFSNHTIAEIYDIENDVVEALHVIKPNFEYPDISYLTVSEFLKRN